MSRSRIGIALVVLPLAALVACSQFTEASGADAAAPIAPPSADDAAASDGGPDAVDPGDAGDASDASDVTVLSESFDAPGACAMWMSVDGNATFGSIPNGHSGLGCEICLTNIMGSSVDTASIARVITLPTSASEGHYVFSGWVRAAAEVAANGDNRITLELQNGPTNLAQNASIAPVLSPSWTPFHTAPLAPSNAGGTASLILTIGSPAGSCFDVDDLTLTLGP